MIKPTMKTHGFGRISGTNNKAGKVRKKSKTKRPVRILTVQLEPGGKQCPFATWKKDNGLPGGCEDKCLKHTGQNRFGPNEKIRKARTEFFWKDRKGFLEVLTRELKAFERKCNRGGYQPAVRLNTLSDIAWEILLPQIFELFPGVIFYDYTKNPKRMGETLPANYSLTYSWNGTEWDWRENAEKFLRRGQNVAVVIKGHKDSKKIGLWPKTWQGFQTVNGYAFEDRFNDPPGSVVMLHNLGEESDIAVPLNWKPNEQTETKFAA